MPSFTPHLDRRYQLPGTWNSGPGTTTWTLPFADPIIASSAGRLVVGENITGAGTVLTYSASPSSASQFGVSGKTVTVTGANYGGHDSIIGIVYDMVLHPTNPIPPNRAYQGAYDFAARVQVRYLDVSHYLSSGYTVRHTMTGRSVRDRIFAGNSDGSVTATGRFRANLNGNTALSTWKIISTTAKRVVIPSIQFQTDINTGRDP